MKKYIIFLSALILAASGITGCAEKQDKISEQESVTEAAETTTTAEPTETTTRNTVEIDPFEGLDFTYHHVENGMVEEKGRSCFVEPQKKYIDNDMKEIQYILESYAKGLRSCNSKGCGLEIYREVIDPHLKEGDTVTYRVVMSKFDIPDEQIPEYLAQAYGVKITRMTMEVPVHFEEDVFKDVDPFEGGSVTVLRENSVFWVEEHLNKSKIVEELHKKKVDISFKLSLVEGIGLNDLYAGDRIKYSVVLTEGGKEYTGEDINKQLEKNWKGVRFTQTEKEYKIIPTYNYRYSTNVNVMLKRPDNWYQIAENRDYFSKYDLRHIDGSTATIPITAELVRQFCDIEDEDIEAYIDHNTTGPAYEELILGKEGKSVIFVTEPSEEELQMAADNNVELNVTPVALDGFVFITHKDNPVDSLTVEQIQGIYSGEITNWAEVGGYDEEIIPYQREANSGSQTVMENMVMNGIPMLQPRTETTPMTMGGLIEHIASYKNSTASIGYTFYYYVNNLYRNDNIKVLRVNDISPDNENLIDKSYPFSSGYFAVTRKDGDPLGDKITDFLLSDEGQDIIKLAGYCPIR